VNLSQAPLDVIIMVLARMSRTDRFTCALVCKAWAEAAAAATRRVVIKSRVQDLSCLQLWMEKHGHNLVFLQLHECDKATLTALPCPQLQNLLLHGTPLGSSDIGSRVWGDIAAATKLTSVSLWHVQTASQLADVVSALTALPNLRQLTWRCVQHSKDRELPDPTNLELDDDDGDDDDDDDDDGNDGVAEALNHLSSLTKMRYLSMDAPFSWASAGCPGLQDLKRLTSLKLLNQHWQLMDLPDSVSQLTGLQQLQVVVATPTGLNGLQGLTRLTQLRVDEICQLSPKSPPLQLPRLQELDLSTTSIGAYQQCMPMSYLASCTRLRTLELVGLILTGPGSLLASTKLQRLTLRVCRCMPNAADAAAGPASWQLAFPSPGCLPRLTYLMFMWEQPGLQQSDMDRVVGCGSRLQVLDLDRVCALHTRDNLAPALARLSGLTSLRLSQLLNDEECGMLAQLTGLRELTVHDSHHVTTAGLRRLAALTQLRILRFTHCFDDSKVSPVLSQQMLSLPGKPSHAHVILNKVCGDHRVVGWGGRARRRDVWCANISYTLMQGPA